MTIECIDDPKIIKAVEVIARQLNKPRERPLFVEEHNPINEEKALNLYVGKMVRHYRLENGITQEKLAKALGITFQQLQKYETGVNRISCGRLVLISRLLDKEIIYFFPL